MAVEEGSTNWFLAQLKPNCANIAERNLKRQGLETFLPLEEETRQRGGKFVTAMRPLFPGYVFVAFDVARGLWRKVNSTYGVTRLVSFGSEPAIVPESLVSGLRQRCDGSGKLLPPPELAPGDHVTMIRGPFANFVGAVERIAPDQRVWVLMDIMGGQTRVAVDAGQLRVG
jgi:transcriptional antiterminator RfaH